MSIWPWDGMRVCCMHCSAVPYCHKLHGFPAWLSGTKEKVNLVRLAFSALMCLPGQQYPTRLEQLFLDALAVNLVV